MSYIQSVCNRLPDDIIEVFDGSNLEIEIDGEYANIWFSTNRGRTTLLAFQIYLDGVLLCAQAADNDPVFRADQLIAIGELVNAMNDIAHKDFMEALSEKESLDGQD